MGASLRRIPTGVSDFDNIIKGGMPLGSVVLLLGDLGAGQNEYAITSAAKLSLVRENPQSAEFFLGTSVRERHMPSRICYITFSRSKEDILEEIRMSFNEDFYDSFKRNVIFQDFSDKYFRQTLVPRSWTGDGSSGLFSNNGEQGLLESMVSWLDENAKDTMVIIDSLTDLLLSTKIEVGWGDLPHPHQGCGGREEATYDHGLGGRCPHVPMEQAGHLLEEAALHVR
jgi:KaiC/GvpD/RAD55 family RecA-like ATPase